MNESTTIFFNWKKQNILFGVLIIGLLIYTSLRAYLLSFTCDEASTYFSHLPNSVFQCFYSDVCWSDANNHLLNTFLMQITTSIFGISELTLRLPNLFGHLIFLIFSTLLVERYSKNFWIALSGFCLLNFNPYLIEFFSLARGYGLGVGWMMMSIYFLLRWIEEYKIDLGIYCFIGAICSVLSNFVFLNYWSGLFAVVCVFIFFENLKLENKQKLRWLLLPISSGVFLFLILIKPIQFLRSKGEFGFGTENFFESFEGLVKVSLMSQGYFNPYTTNVFLGLAIILLAVSTIYGFYSFLKSEKQYIYKIHFASVLLLILILIGVFVQYYFLGVKFLEGRKTTILIPLFGLTVYVLLEKLYQSHLTKFSVLFSILISIFSFIHFQRTFDLRETVEWDYDAKTKNMIAFIQDNFPKDKKIKLGVYWIYGPASEFYQEQFKMNNLQIKRLDDDLDHIGELDFIYIQPHQLIKVKENNSVEKDFEKGLLLKL